jgi:hypothetical protein
LYPAAANQTIYAHRASKIDEGIYTCVLTNETHKMEHRIELKVKSSSPDIPLATFTPVDQFANIDGSARFYCEAFVGKKDLPDIEISIRWYQLTDDNEINSISENEVIGGVQEAVKREDEQIIGSYLTINSVTLNHFGRYLCRIEMGNSKQHRLDMTASLINALPLEASVKTIMTNPIFLGTCAALFAIITFFLLLFCTHSWCMNKIRLLQKNKEMAFNVQDSAPLTFHKSKKVSRSERDDTKIMIDRM